MSKMDANRLWAKRWRTRAEVPESAYLLGHLQDVHHAAAQILDATAATQLRVLGLNDTAWKDRLWRIVLLAAAVHDLGKCNSQFQAMLEKWGKQQEGQRLRHEWATLLILDDPTWRDWLMPAVGGDETEWQMVRWCVSGHHPKYGRSAPPEPEQSQGSLEMCLPLNHCDVNKIVKWISETFALTGQPPLLESRTVELGTFSNDKAMDRLINGYYDAEEAFAEFDADARRFLAAAKDTLIAADVAGSALPREVTDDAERKRWIGDILDPKNLPAEEAYRHIAEAHLKNKQPDEDGRAAFQANVAATSGRVTFVKAGCGTGKTLAAYRWAQKHCPGKRLFICYPTTGTALEGFKDYLRDPALAEYVKTNLVTSKARIDLTLAIDGVAEDSGEAVARMESLDLWQTPVVACTVDAVLGVVQNNRRGMFGWPAIAQGGFVFDEIHSYDDKLFDALLHFLSVMRGVPILLMTASLPDARLDAIKMCLAQGEELAQVPGPTALEQRKRYRRHAAPKQAEELVEIIRSELEAGGRVLRVCNTVPSAMREAEALEAAGLSPMLYHSRFKYKDRLEQHKKVVASFKSNQPALAVCTQVAEMSLDLSATMLVTDLAPVPALIQRLGRLNRHAKKGDKARPFIITEPQGKDGKFSPLPYDADDLETARQWLEKLGEGDLSQQDLAQTWADFQSDAPPSRWQSAWLDYGPDNPVLELREGSPSITVVMEEDVQALYAGDPPAKFALPMPLPPKKSGDKPFDWHVRDYHGIPIAREGGIGYDPQKGAKWRQ